MTTATTEAARLVTLLDYVALDAPAGPELDAVVRLAASVAGVPTATVSILDGHLQHQLATVGFAGRARAREDSLCHTSLGIGGFVHTPDATQDPRFCSGPSVDGRQ